jgi:hypothetical protein
MITPLRLNPLCCLRKQLSRTAYVVITWHGSHMFVGKNEHRDFSTYNIVFLQGSDIRVPGCAMPDEYFQS